MRNWPVAGLRGGRKMASIRAATANCFCNTSSKPTKDATLIFSRALLRSPNRRSTKWKDSGKTIWGGHKSRACEQVIRFELTTVLTSLTCRPFAPKSAHAVEENEE